ncbi:MAG TPA: hypothetical protein VEH28_07375 [Thermoplasmata archaeon]|nr:hypothetical protein [Thermoplasmata archaeon]
MNRSEPALRRRILWIGLAVAVAFSAGLGVAWAALSVSPVTIHGAGNYVHTTRLTFWTQQAAWTTSIPAAVPAAASTTIGTPSILPATGQAYRINAATAGHGAVQWNFTETTTPPHNAEFEITFQITSGATPTNSTITVYFETQAANPASALTFVLYFDAGAGTAVLDRSIELTQQCTGVGACP